MRTRAKKFPAINKYLVFYFNDFDRFIFCKIGGKFKTFGYFPLIPCKDKDRFLSFELYCTEKMPILKFPPILQKNKYVKIIKVKN